MAKGSSTSVSHCDGSSRSKQASAGDTGKADAGLAAPPGLRADGGAPYMMEYVCACSGGRYGSPSYDPDEFDTPSTYPALTERFGWSSQQGWVSYS